MDSSSSDDEYIETEKEVFTAECLFCDSNDLELETIFDHIKTAHGIDFLDDCHRNNLDSYQFIKLVNFLRKNGKKPDDFSKILQEKLFDYEEFLKPSIQDDYLLMFDFEGEVSPESIDIEKEIMIKPEIEIIKSLSSLSKDELLILVKNMMQKFKKTKQSLLDIVNFISANDSNVTQIDNVESSKSNLVTTLNVEHDQSYIDSYSHYSIHHQMLSDKTRTLSYQDAILENDSFFRNKTVLDIGCGVGVLSLFAAKAGAKIVVAVDQSDIIKNAQRIIWENKMEDKIKTVKGKLEQLDFAKLQLPEKYDIIVSEWMGYFLLFEGMLDTVLFARNHLLSDRGVLLPDRCKLFISAFSDCSIYEKYIDFWNDVYGFNMSSIVPDVISEAIVESIRPENICSSIDKISDINISDCSIHSVSKIESDFELKFNNDSTIHGLVGWFDCNFESMSKLIILSTSPFSEPTHWKQTIFLFKEPIIIKSGQMISGKILITKDVSNPRGLKIIFKIESNQSGTFAYSMN